MNWPFVYDAIAQYPADGLDAAVCEVYAPEGWQDIECCLDGRNDSTARLVELCLVEGSCDIDVGDVDGRVVGIWYHGVLCVAGTLCHEVEEAAGSGRGPDDYYAAR